MTMTGNFDLEATADVIIVNFRGVSPQGKSNPAGTIAIDGIAKSFADEKSFLAIARQYRDTLQKVGLSEVLGRLDEWLAEVSKRGSGDDVTLCLASRTPGRAPAADDDSDW